MPMTSRREPAVLVAGLVTSILWIGTAVLSDWVHANFTYRVHSALVRTLLPHPHGTVPGGSTVTGQTILAAFLAGMVVMGITYVATRRLPHRTGTWALFLATWFAAVVGAAAGSVADTVADVAFPPLMNPAFSLLAASFTGAWWGLVNGWIVGAAFVGSLALTGRSATPHPSAPLRARELLRTRAYPTVLVAGLTAATLWAAAGFAGSWLAWHRSARGPIDLVVEVAPGAMIFRLTPHARPLEVSEVVLAVGVGLVVAAGTWLATRRLPPHAGRWTLVFAVWFVVALAAVVAAAVRSFVAYSWFGPHAALMSMVLPSMQASLFLPLALGGAVGLLAVLVYARTGATVVADAEPTEPDGPAEPDDSAAPPRSALHTDADEPSRVP